MKKLIPLLLVAVLVLGMAACGTAAPASPAATAAPAAEPAAEPAAPADPDLMTITDADTPIHLTVVSAGNTQDSNLSAGFMKFCELVELYSGGNITADCYFGSEMGSLQACLEGCFSGTIDMTCCGPSYLTGYCPEIQALELPFVFKTAQEARAVIDGEIGQALAAKLYGTGAFIGAFYETGMRELMNSKHPVKVPADLVGLKIRCAPSATQNATWEAFGAIPMAIDFSETFTALQNGTVDGNANSIPVMASSKFYEVQQYMSISNFEYAPATAMFSEATWNKLTENQQAIVQRALDESRDYQRQYTDDMNSVALQQMIDNGVQVTPAEEVDYDAFKALVQPVYDIFVDNGGSMDILDQIAANITQLYADGTLK